MGKNTSFGVLTKELFEGSFASQFNRNFSDSNHQLMQFIEDFIKRQGLELVGEDFEIKVFLEEYGWYLKLKNIKEPGSLEAKFITALFFSNHLDKIKKPPHWKLRFWAFMGKFLGYRI